MQLHTRICNWKNTGKLKQTAYMSLCSWGQWLVMWAFCKTWRCWFCLVPHEEYLSLVCEQKATKQVEFIRLMVLRQTCSIVSAKPSLTSNSAVVEHQRCYNAIHGTRTTTACVFPVTYSSVQFPAVAFQLHSSCKFQLQILFPLGETFASSSIIETWHLIRICLLSFCACECFPQCK